MMLLAPPAGNGWLKEGGKFLIDWDSNENMQAVKQRVDLLLKGCACKGGCNTDMKTMKMTQRRNT